MHRRDFLRSMATSAGATALPLAANLGGATKPQASDGPLSGGGSTAGFAATDFVSRLRKATLYVADFTLGQRFGET